MSRNFSYRLSWACSSIEILIALNLRIRLFWIYGDYRRTAWVSVKFSWGIRFFFIDFLGWKECVKTLFGIFCKIICLFLQVWSTTVVGNTCTLLSVRVPLWMSVYGIVEMVGVQIFAVPLILHHSFCFTGVTFRLTPFC